MRRSSASQAIFAIEGTDGEDQLLCALDGVEVGAAVDNRASPLCRLHLHSWSIGTPGIHPFQQLLLTLLGLQRIAWQL